MITFLNCVRSEYGGNVLDIVVDGTYPFDDKPCIWEQAARITRDAGLELCGMPKDKSNHNTMLNKGFCVYAMDLAYVYAVYNHDGRWNIIRAKRGDFNKYIAKSGLHQGHPAEVRGVRAMTACDNKCCETYETPALAGES